jgi:hypothetical protein
MASPNTMEIYTIMEESLKMPWHRPGDSRCQYYIKPFSSPLTFMLEYGKLFQTSLVFSRKTRVLFVEAFTVQPDHGYSPRINDIKYWHSCCQNLKEFAQIIEYNQLKKFYKLGSQPFSQILY